MQRILGLKMVTVDLNWDAVFRFVNLSGVCAVAALWMKASNLATTKDVHESVKDLATKESFKDLATKESLKDLATKESLKDLATKESLKDLEESVATKFKRGNEKYRSGLLYLANGLNGLRAEKQADLDEQIFGDQQD
jgi:hypothetical protein